MNYIYIQKSNFSQAEEIIDILSSRVINVKAIENIHENEKTNLGSTNAIYVCSSIWEEKLGGQQGLLDFARKLKAKSIQLRDLG